MGEGSEEGLVGLGWSGWAGMTSVRYDGKWTGETEKEGVGRGGGEGKGEDAM